MRSFDLEFTKDGAVFDPAQVQAALDALPDITDLIVISHGWNNNTQEARALYDGFFKSVTDVLNTGLVDDLKPRKFAALRLFWPSKKFEDEELIPGGGAASATPANDAALARVLEELKNDPARLGGSDRPQQRATRLSEAQALIPQLDSSADARARFVENLRAIVDSTDAHIEDGSDEFFAATAEEIFAELSQSVAAPGGTTAGGSTSVSDSGGAAGLRDMLEGVQAAARRIVNFTTYFAMKTRAGTVGIKGLAPVLRQIRGRKADVRLHLVGHSFGGRLVTAAAHALPDESPAITLTLLQAAYSHNGLSADFDQKGHSGAFREVISRKRVSGPIIITHTKNDKAVGIAYPLASRLSRDAAAALGDENDPYGGLGRNGAQHTNEARKEQLLAVGGTYSFKPGQIHNLKADGFIADHGAVEGVQVAYAFLCSVRAA